MNPEILEQALKQSFDVAQNEKKVLFISDIQITKEIWELCKKNNWPIIELQKQGFLTITRTGGPPSQDGKFINFVEGIRAQRGLDLLVLFLGENPVNVISELENKGIQVFLARYS